MTPTAIIKKAKEDGVNLSLSPTGTLKATGDGAAVNRWLPVIRERKAEIIEALNGSTSSEESAPPFSGGAAFASWRVTFPDGTTTTTTSYPPATLAQMQEVYRNGECLEPIMPDPDDGPDNRITCQQCSNLTASGACRVARPGDEVSANRGYKPNATTLHRCSAYLPGADDPDQRPAAIRWPGLTTRKEAR